MKTSKPFSTISYNTDAFLQDKLNDLVNKQVISFYAFINHYAEKDESKNHKHLLIIPNGLIQTDMLKDYLQELDPSNPLKPLGIMPVQSSKFADWYLYCCHNVAYLASKGQAREYHYSFEDFITSHTDYLNELVHTIDYSKYTKQQELIAKIQEGFSFNDLLMTGQIPVPQINQWKQVYDLIHGGVFRNDRTTHTPVINKDTGEIYE